MAWKLSRSRVNHPLRYFVYVSDAKLEMLFDQIPPQLRRRLSAQAKVDLKLASLSIKAAEQPAPTRMAKLKVVERYIDRHQRVGTVQEPGSEYFRGTMPMRWGWLRDPAAPNDPSRLQRVVLGVHVGPHGERRIGVPEPCGDDCDGHSLRVHDAGAGMSCVV